MNSFQRACVLCLSKISVSSSNTLAVNFLQCWQQYNGYKDSEPMAEQVFSCSDCAQRLEAFCQFYEQLEVLKSRLKYLKRSFVNTAFFTSPVAIRLSHARRVNHANSDDDIFCNELTTWRKIFRKVVGSTNEFSSTALRDVNNCKQTMLKSVPDFTSETSKATAKFFDVGKRHAFIDLTGRPNKEAFPPLNQESVLRMAVSKDALNLQTSPTSKLMEILEDLQPDYTEAQLQNRVPSFCGNSCAKRSLNQNPEKSVNKIGGIDSNKRFKDAIIHHSSQSNQISSNTSDTNAFAELTVESLLLGNKSSIRSRSRNPQQTLELTHTNKEFSNSSKQCDPFADIGIGSLLQFTSSRSSFSTLVPQNQPSYGGIECTSCGGYFVSLSLYENHRVVYQKNNKCKYCDRTFTNNCVFQEQEKRHVNHKPSLYR